MHPDPSPPTTVYFGVDVLDRMVEAARRVRERLLRSTAALEAAHVPYAVIGEIAVGTWISRVDPAAARNAVAVEFLVNRGDCDAIRSALESVGFVHDDGTGVDLFLDGPSGTSREAIRLSYGSDKDALGSTDDFAGSVRHESYWIVPLEQLVRMKLASFRLLDRVQVRDMVDVGLVDATWTAKLPFELGRRLQELLDHPE